VDSILCNLTCFGRTGRSRIRLIAVLLCVCLIVAILLSSVFVLTNANHSHDRYGPYGSCTTCTRVMAAENLLYTLSLAFAFAVPVLSGCYALMICVRPALFGAGFPSLVFLKVRLNH
jgi:hypothetical protein